MCPKKSQTTAAQAAAAQAAAAAAAALSKPVRAAQVLDIGVGILHNRSPEVAVNIHYSAQEIK